MMRGLGLALAGLLVALGAARAAVPVPTENDARLAMEAYERGNWRYRGVISGPALSGRLELSLVEAPGGEIVGEALLLTPDRHLLAASPVSGRAAGTACRLDLAFGGRSETLDGICSPGLIGGRVISAPPSPDLITRLVFWWGDRSTEGEAWLAPSAGL